METISILQNIHVIKPNLISMGRLGKLNHFSGMCVVEKGNLKKREIGKFLVGESEVGKFLIKLKRTERV